MVKSDQELALERMFKEFPIHTHHDYAFRVEVDGAVIVTCHLADINEIDEVFTRLVNMIFSDGVEENAKITLIHINDVSSTYFDGSKLKAYRDRIRGGEDN